jgi:hypothetical protein
LALAESDERLVSEAADLWFHLLMLLRSRGSSQLPAVAELHAAWAHELLAARGASAAALAQLLQALDEARYAHTALPPLSRWELRRRWREALAALKRH